MKLRDLPGAMIHGLHSLRHKVWGDPEVEFDESGVVDDAEVDEFDGIGTPWHESRSGQRWVEPPPVRKSPVHVEFGGQTGLVYAGPYGELVRADAPDNALMICMAAELQHLPHDVLVPTHDFCTPDPFLMEIALLRAIRAVAMRQPVAVGCKGGIGRTGLFLALLAKVMYAMGRLDQEPLAFVRAVYYPHAVETKGQIAYLHTFDVSRLVMVANELESGVTEPSARLARRGPYTGHAPAGLSHKTPQTL